MRKHLKQLIEFGTRPSVTLWWALSYIAIIALSMVVALAVYATTEHALKEQVKDSSLQLMSQVQNHIDSMIDDAKMMAIEISLNPEVASLMAQPEALSEKSPLVKRTMDQLRAYRMANQSIDEMYLYRRKADEVVSDRTLTDSTSYYRLHVSDQDNEQTQWRQRFNQYHLGDFVLNLARGRFTKKQYDSLSYVKSLPLSRPDLNYGAVVINIKTDKLMKVLNGYGAKSNSAFLIVDSSGQLIWSSGGETQRDLIEAPLFSGFRRAIGNPLAFEGNHQQWFFTKEQQVISTYRSETQNWHYILITPYQTYWAGLKEARFYLFFGMFIILASGSSLTKYAIKRHYEPVRQMLCMVDTKDQKSQKSNIPWEYQYINQALSQHQMEKLLKGQLSQSALISALETGIVSFRYGYWLLAKVNLTPEVNAVLKRGFMAWDFCADLFYVTEGDCALVLINGTDESTLETICNQLKCHLDQDSLLVFAPLNALEVLEPVRNELEGLWDFAFLKGLKGFLDVSQLKVEAPQNYSYPIEKEHLVLSCFQKYDFVTVQSLLQDVLSDNLTGRRLSHTQLLGLKHALLTTVVRGIHLIGLGHDSQIAHMTTECLDSQCLDIFEARLSRLVGWLANVSVSAKEQLIEAEKSGLIAQVNALIAAGAHHPDYSLTRLSEEIGKAPYYLSNLYKQATEISINDAITKMRLDRAVLIMKETDEGLETVAHKSGFGSLKTFSRLFTKVYGMTPGKYRTDFLRDRASVFNALSQEL